MELDEMPVAVDLDCHASGDSGLEGDCFHYQSQ